MGLANWFSAADRAQMALERILPNRTWPATITKRSARRERRDEAIDHHRVSADVRSRWAPRLRVGGRRGLAAAAFGGDPFQVSALVKRRERIDRQAVRAAPVLDRRADVGREGVVEHRL